MIDYQRKAEIISSGLVKEVKNLRQGLFRSVDDLEKDYYYDKLHDLYDENYDNFTEACKIARNDFNRNTRLKNRIRDYLEIGDCIFVTMTFTDDVLNSTTVDTRRQYVRKQLKLMSKYYIANIDFGAKNGREHYHAIIVSDFADRSLWKYGNIDFKRIIKSSNPLVLAKYVSKLANHAIKETCKRNHIIYSVVPWDERVKDRKRGNDDLSLDKVIVSRIDSPLI